MKVDVKKISGPWDLGYSLDKHKIRSIFTGNNEFGRPTFDTLRTEAGEAVYQLKYKQDWSQAAALAKAVHVNMVPNFPNIGLVIPMPASQVRERQPVDAVAEELAKLMSVGCFGNIIVKAPSISGKKLKDLDTKQEKEEELAGRFSINDGIADGKWNGLIIDDLYDTGASLEAAAEILRTYRKINRIYVATLTRIE